MNAFNGGWRHGLHGAHGAPDLWIAQLLVKDVVFQLEDYGLSAVIALPFIVLELVMESWSCCHVWKS